ncbi:MAG TPA: CTP synthase [Candidatus Nanoarchaeia archaeon]|nr:CTP synthase [Candidatus Nanoarchaeia archaeon]
MVKFIVVAGGVISGVGKGVTTSSIGKILQEYGFKVTAVKIDPYINFDAGTLRPTEHGEVWVTDDGGEIDQDLGNYERFLGADIPKKNNITTGQVYGKVIENERAGKYLGETVQFIPHIPDEIKKRIKDAAEGFDFCLVEIGGTIGDYENIPFLFAMKSLERELGKENVVYVLITYLPVPSHIEEMKTKPTQQAIRLLTEHGIMPDFIICRAKKPLDAIRKKKIELYANIRSDHVISEPDIDTIYRIPLDLEKEGFGTKLLDYVGLKPKAKPDWREWKKLVDNIADNGKPVRVAMVGKYVDIGDFTLTDSYISINQALLHAAANLNAKIEIEWIDSKSFEKDESKLSVLKKYNGIIVPGGFGATGVEGKIAAIKYARENNIPFLGLCYGMQLAVVEYARNVCGLKGANTTEVDKGTKYPVIDILPSQEKILAEGKYGGTMRLGAYTAILKEGSKVLALYKERIEDDKKRIARLKDGETFRLGKLEEGKKAILERHRHRFEMNPKFIEETEKKGLVYSGYHIRVDGEKLMEFVELPKHKFFIGTQAHPEFKSSLTKPAPLFYGFVKAAMG